jgi:hypothetical protein
MNPNTTLSLSVVAIAALVLLFASGPIVAAHQASAVVYVHRHYGYHHGHYYRHYHGHYHGYYHGHYYRHYHGHGVYHKGVTVKTPRGIYHKGVTVRAY